MVGVDWCSKGKLRLSTVTRFATSQQANSETDSESIGRPAGFRPPNLVVVARRRTRARALRPGHPEERRGSGLKSRRPPDGAGRLRTLEVGAPGVRASVFAPPSGGRHRRGRQRIGPRPVLVARRKQFSMARARNDFGAISQLFRTKWAVSFSRWQTRPCWATSSPLWCGVGCATRQPRSRNDAASMRPK